MISLIWNLATASSLRAQDVYASVYELYGLIQQIRVRDVQKAFHMPADFSSHGTRPPAEVSF